MKDFVAGKDKRYVLRTWNFGKGHKKFLSFGGVNVQCDLATLDVLGKKMQNDVRWTEHAFGSVESYRRELRQFKAL